MQEHRQILQSSVFPTLVRLALGLALLGLASGPLPTYATPAATITVTTTTDVLDAAAGCGTVALDTLPGPDGVTSLREAMCAANNNSGPDTIGFAIPGCGSGCTIEPTIALPVLTDDGTTIDGYTQSGAAPATESAAATLLIELDGSTIVANNGLNVASADNVIRGLAINRFILNGVAIGGVAASGNVIAGNHIGTDRSGSTAMANGSNGVFVGLGASDNVVGGDDPAERNVISGNVQEGVGIHGSGTGSNTVSGNYIGTNATGTGNLGNELHGVRIYGGSQNNVIGGDTPGERNVISGNAEQGVQIRGAGTTGNVVRGNYIGLSIDLDPLGNTRNGVHILWEAQDNTVGPDNTIAYNGDDGVAVDTPTAVGNVITDNHIFGNGSLGIHVTNGANNGIGSPQILSVTSIPGLILGTACPGCTVEVFQNQDDEGEGLWLLGRAVANGAGDFGVPVEYLFYPYLTATATDTDDGTSQFSDVFTAETPVLHEESEKTVDRETASPGETLTYTISIANTGASAATARLTDTFPSETMWANNASASSGRLTWEAETGRVLWNGTVELSTPVTITFELELKKGLPNGKLIENEARINDGAGFAFTVEAEPVTVVAYYVYLPLVVRAP